MNKSFESPDLVKQYTQPMPYECKTCQDHHYVCSRTDSSPCEPHENNLAHDWIPCPSCQTPETTQHNCSPGCKLTWPERHEESMTPKPLQENWEERFDIEFCVYFDEHGRPTRSSYSGWISKDIKSFIKKELAAAEKRGYAAGVARCEKVVDAVHPRALGATPESNNHFDCWESQWRHCIEALRAIKDEVEKK